MRAVDLVGGARPAENAFVEIRKATADDAGFLLEMLVEACNWTGEQRIARGDVEVDPRLAHYITDWPRARDFGVIAVGDDRARVGAAWARTFSAQDPGYGFVAADIPEISMAVVASQRGHGIGRRLLQAVVDIAEQNGWRALSLSVADGNSATRLYRAAGFNRVGRNESSDTMVLDLTPDIGLKPVRGCR